MSFELTGRNASQNKPSNNFGKNKTCVAKGDEISLPVTYVKLSAENKQLKYFRHFFPLCFTKCKLKQYKQKKIRGKPKKTRAKEREKLSPCSFRVLCKMLAKRAGRVRHYNGDKSGFFKC